MFAAICIFLCLQLIRGTPLERTTEKDTRPLCPCGNNASSVNTRVVGGHPVGKNTIPYATGLLFRSSFGGRALATHPFCGGTLITDRHVVTAAHCLRDHSPKNINVDVGDYSLRDASDGQVIAARNLTKYPDYVLNHFHTDIGVVELEQPIQFVSGVHQTARLPRSGMELEPGTTVAVYGWGRLEYSGNQPDKLQAVALPVVANDECQKKFVSTIESRMICAGGEEGKDACIGDSGSGLVVQLDNELVLCGVVSFGRNCALPGVPGVYTKVSGFTDWVLEQTRSAGCRPCVHGEKE